ncbi:HAD family hydrolase [Alkalicaulis satelles]|uniref:HAD family hydrolase n=1 Tax=Alkalicaulis satelles TaxID=2609175 RepID=A0A5M6ZF47_9PROT|nr:HAD family hydrolase [Alkalicaulis satelles]KAA5802387.1 HAD family hydrolase [Alkalicaulis satelles]
MRLAMWSGPRNLSTALMYAFGSRADCAVIDEPFYAAYLARTGLDHPMRDAVIAAGETDPDAVIAHLTGPVPGGKALFYQKHMCHHMLDGFRRDWLDQCANVFLIRHPARVAASFDARHENPTLEDLGVPQQSALFDEVAARGLPAFIIDSADIRAYPRAALTALCEALGIGFDPAMLSWTAGGRPEDGVWGPHWYAAVHASTGFAGPEGDLPVLPARLQGVADAAMETYQRLHALRLKPV